MQWKKEKITLQDGSIVDAYTYRCRLSKKTIISILLKN